MWSSFAVSFQLDPLSNIYLNIEKTPYLFYIQSNKTYPATLPTLRPPKTIPTALDRSSNGIVLQMVLEKSNQVEKRNYASSLIRHNIVFLLIMIRHNLQYRKCNSDRITKYNKTPASTRLEPYHTPQFNFTKSCQNQQPTISPINQTY